MKQSFLSTFICLAAINAFAQGSLTPSGAPGATMKTLSQIEPRVPISTLPYVITNAGAYYMTTNLFIASSTAYGISISANNVDLDLGGFALTGTSVDNSAVYLTGAYTNVTVRHGTISGWGSMGVNAFLGSGVANACNFVCADLQVFNCNSVGIWSVAQNTTLRNCLCCSNASVGIEINAGSITACIAIANKNIGILANDAVITDCLSISNTTYGFSGNNNNFYHCNSKFNLSSGFSITGGRLVDCFASFCTANGIDAANASVMNCTAQGCGVYGIIANNSAVSGCTVISNAISGIYCTGGGGLFTGNLVNGNNTANSGGSAGIYINSSNNRLENNHLFGNGASGYGICVLSSSFTNNIVVKNSVIGNGAKNFVFLAGDIGPVGTATNSTSPWANISH